MDAKQITIELCSSLKSKYNNYWEAKYENTKINLHFYAYWRVRNYRLWRLRPHA